KPIIAAVPPGENRDFLAGWPGVWIVRPDSLAELADAVEEVWNLRRKDSALRFDRSARTREFEYHVLGKKLRTLIDNVCANGRTR
ncbi:MAG TPA: hypothetical protein PKO06_21785, partial [Candidatus Ozemobacteraceae bacterium]|nr:hypothetical protein [Candidatus Ozemobacteraceae bacterium]